MSSLLHFSASMAREIMKPQKILKNLRLTVPPQLVTRSVILEDITERSQNREDTVSHHRLIVRQWLLYEMLHYPPGCPRETFKTIKWKNNYMALVSFGHPVHRQDAKEKPLQTQKKKS